MMTQRASTGLPATLMLVIFLTQFTLSSWPVSAADDFDSLRAEVSAANSGRSRVITLSGDIVLTAALPAITGRVTIDGAGHSISGNDAQRIFDVNGGALTLSNVTLTGGKATESEGGAIRLRNGAVVTIERSTLSANSATHGGAIATSSGGDRLNISDSNFSGNIAEQSAGAIYARSAVVNITGSSFVKNCALYAFFRLNETVNSDRRTVDDQGCHRATFVRTDFDTEVESHVDGGAIRLENGARVSVEGSSFSENSATNGGAISAVNNSVRLSVNNSSFISNRARASGGAIGAYWLGSGRIAISNSSFVKNATEDGNGGAIEAGQGVFEIANSTFSENVADSSGGALNIDQDAEVTITHSTFVENRTSRNQAKAISKTGGKAYLRNSIIASSGSGEDCVGVWDQNSGNLSPDGTCADRPSDNPLLGELTGSPAFIPCGIAARRLTTRIRLFVWKPIRSVRRALKAEAVISARLKPGAPSLPSQRRCRPWSAAWPNRSSPPTATGQQEAARLAAESIPLPWRRTSRYSQPCRRSPAIS